MNKIFINKMYFLFILLLSIRPIVHAKNRGLTNAIGATCYMNASLQCLTHLKLFNNYLQEHQQLYKSDSPDNGFNNGRERVNEYLKVSNKIQVKDGDDTYLDDEQFKDFVANASGAYFPKDPNNQQDAAEFVNYFITECIECNRIYNSLNQNKKLLYLPQWIHQSFLKDNPLLSDEGKDLLPLIRLFGIRKKQLTHQLSDGAGFHIKEEYFFSPIFYVSAQYKNNIFSMKNIENLKEALEQYCLTQNNIEWACSSCNDYVYKDAKEEYAIYYPPKIFIFNLLVRKEDGSKVKTPIAYPLTFSIAEMEKCLGPEIKEWLKANKDRSLHYTLKAIAIHHGDSLYEGHYTACCLDDLGEWYYYNDANKAVKMAQADVEADRIINKYASSTPYLLFYTLDNAEILDSFDPIKSEIKKDEGESEANNVVNSLAHLRKGLQNLKNKLGLLKDILGSLYKGVLGKAYSDEK